MTTETADASLRDAVLRLARRWPWIVASLAAVLLLSFFFLNQRSPAFEATARVALNSTAAQDLIDPTAGGGAFGASRDLENEINAAESDVTTDAVREALGLGPDERLPEGAISADPTSDLLWFTMRGSTAEEAALNANTWAEVFVQTRQQNIQASIEDAVVVLEERLTGLRSERDDVRADLEDLEDQLVRAVTDEARALFQLQVDRERSAISGEMTLIETRIASSIDSIDQLIISGELAAAGSLRVVDFASPPRAPSNTSAPVVLIVAGVFGLMLGVGVALLAENFDRSISDIEDIRSLGLPVLGGIPRADRKQQRQGLEFPPTSSPIADSYQRIRTALQFALLNSDTKTIMVTSPQQGDGKTTTSLNLATTFTDHETQVALVDIDFRRPRVHEVFDTHRQPGVGDYSPDVDTTSLRRTNPSTGSLVTVTAGARPINPPAFLSSSTMAHFVDELSEENDVTIFDAPPILPVADADAFASLVDGVILVVRAGRTTVDEIEDSVEHITRAGAKLLGVIVNQTSSGGRKSSYGYGYGESSEYDHSFVGTLAALPRAKAEPVETAEEIYEADQELEVEAIEVDELEVEAIEVEELKAEEAEDAEVVGVHSAQPVPRWGRREAFVDVENVDEQQDFEELEGAVEFEEQDEFEELENAAELEEQDEFETSAAALAEGPDAMMRAPEVLVLED